MARIPIHDHSDLNSGGKLRVSSAIQGGVEAVSTSSPVPIHNTLPGLGDNDHPQYVRATDGGGEVPFSLGSMGAAKTVDLVNGNYQYGTLTAACTLTFTAPASGRVRSWTLETTQDGTGGWAITWPGSVVWPGGSAPSPDDDPGAIVFYVFHTRDAGTTWYGFPVGGGAGSAQNLSDLLDALIVSPVANDTLRYLGGVWVNDARVWRPLMDGLGNVITDSGTGEAIAVLS